MTKPDKRKTIVFKQMQERASLIWSIEQIAERLYRAGDEGDFEESAIPSGISDILNIVDLAYAEGQDELVQMDKYGRKITVCPQCKHCKGIEVVNLRKEGKTYGQIMKIAGIKHLNSVVQFLKRYEQTR